MCGIYGGVFARATPIDDRLARTRERLAHRGPDDRGETRDDVGESCVVLGHTRLSILDLSSAGRQPLSTADGRFRMTFNGEIYNYVELRAELAELGHAFATQTDSEVLLAAFAQWGTQCLQRLVGMFAFAIYDAREQTLWLARDPFGIKPLFWCRTGSTVSFASEVPALLALRQTVPRLDHRAAYDYLVHGDYDTGSGSFVEDVHALEPGHLLRIDVGKADPARPRRWYSLRVDQDDSLGPNEAAEQLRTLFLDSVRLHLRSDVPVGAALSGGLDSSAVVCAMRAIEPDMDIHTFTFVAPRGAVNEEPWARQVVEATGAISHRVTVSPDDLVRDLDAMIRAQGEPFGSTSIYAQYRVFRAAREAGITVTLEGQGADEMLAGYIGYPGPRVHSLLDDGQWLSAARFLRRWAQWPGRSPAMGLKLVAAAMTSGRVNRALRRLDGRSATPPWIRQAALEGTGVALRHPSEHRPAPLRGRRLSAMLRHQLTYRGLPKLLRHGDRNSMAVSIEGRVPFLTPALAEFLLRRPEEFLITADGETKGIFRRAMRGIVPDAILDRRDKVGFATPEYEWLRANQATFRRWIGEAPQVPWLDRARVLEHFDAMVGNRAPFSWLAWRWICFSRWQTTSGVAT